MKKYIIFLSVFILLCGCDKKNNQYIVKDNLNERINYMLENMTLDEKIGQMMIVFYTAPEVDDTLREVLYTVKPGGFILYKENITTYYNTLKLIKEIKNTADIPMFISIDQEGGNVQRLLSLQDKTVSNIPYMYDVGITNDEKLAKDVGKVIAEELRVFGINMDFAPSLDIFSNPQNTVIGKRSFGNNSEIVTKMGLALATGLSENGIIPVYKHFPGHGNTSTDSHDELPIVNKTKEELYNLELIPFMKAIENGAQIIMIGHLAIPNITGNNLPASISKSFITDFLRNELKYNDLIVTDALNMKALTNYYTQEEIYIKAVEAGVDILLIPSSSKECLEIIKKAVLTGRITEERIDASVKKILKLKYENIEKSYNDYLPSKYLNSKEHQDILKKVKVEEVIK